jgi:hypothetical protein
MPHFSSLSKFVSPPLHNLPAAAQSIPALSLPSALSSSLQHPDADFEATAHHDSDRFSFFSNSHASSSPALSSPSPPLHSSASNSLIGSGGGTSGGVSHASHSYDTLSSCVDEILAFCIRERMIPRESVIKKRLADSPFHTVLLEEFVTFACETTQRCVVEGEAPQRIIWPRDPATSGAQKFECVDIFVPQVRLLDSEMQALLQFLWRERPTVQKGRFGMACALTDAVSEILIANKRLARGDKLSHGTPTAGARVAAAFAHFLLSANSVCVGLLGLMMELVQVLLNEKILLFKKGVVSTSPHLEIDARTGDVFLPDAFRKKKKAQTHAAAAAAPAAAKSMPPTPNVEHLNRGLGRSTAGGSHGGASSLYNTMPTATRRIHHYRSNQHAISHRRPGSASPLMSSASFDRDLSANAALASLGAGAGYGSSPADFQQRERSFSATTGSPARSSFSSLSSASGGHSPSPSVLSLLRQNSGASPLLSDSIHDRAATFNGSAVARNDFVSASPAAGSAAKRPSASLSAAASGFYQTHQSGAALERNDKSAPAQFELDSGFFAHSSPLLAAVAPSASSADALSADAPVWSTIDNSRSGGDSAPVDSATLS